MKLIPIKALLLNNYTAPSGNMNLEETWEYWSKLKSQLNT